MWVKVQPSLLPNVIRHMSVKTNSAQELYYGVSNVKRNNISPSKYCTRLSLFKPLYRFFGFMLLDKIFQNPLQYFEEFWWSLHSGRHDPYRIFFKNKTFSFVPILSKSTTNRIFSSTINCYYKNYKFWKRKIP